MLVACVMFAIMGALVYQVKVWNADESAMMASFIRVFVNLSAVVLLSQWVKHNGVPLGIKGLFGDMRGSLWLRGFFGTLSVISVFYAMHVIGVGEASFLNTSYALWIGLLSPWFLKQPNSKLGWTAIGVGVVGLYLLFQPDFHHDLFMGRMVALASGLFTATAYLMISRAGKTNHSLTVVFYFTFVAALMHAAWFMFVPPVWPTSSNAWFALVGAGIAASVAQVCMTKAYQNAPAALVSAVSYATPVLNMLFAIWIFGDYPNLRSTVGAVIVVLSGVALPFIQTRRIMKVDPKRVPEEVTS